jgi:solute:Na+ symporter, SSS family
MALTSIDLIVITGFLILFLVIALRFRMDAGKSLSNFFLGGQNLPWYIAGTSMVATTFAADTPLAVTELVAKNGISGNWIWWNMLAGGMLTTFFFARYWRRAGILTDVELINIRYSGIAAKYLRMFKAVYMGVFLNAIIIGWVNVALMSLLEVFFDIDRQTSLFITAGAMVLVMGYSAISGLLGVVYTDVLQFILAMTGSILLAVHVLNSPQIGGVENLKTALPDAAFSFFPTLGENTGTTLALGIGSFLAFIAVQWWASWYPGNEPGGGGYIAQRMMSTKDEKHATYASLFFQIAHYCIRPWPWILVALASMVLYPSLTDPKLGYVMTMRDFLPDGIRGMLLVAFLAAYMSTISTQLNWGASYLVNDLLSQVPKKINLMKASRWSTIALAGIALGVTTQINSIAAVWQFLMECGAGLGLVLILRWYWWRVNAWSEITATLAPFVGYYVGHYLLKLEFPESFFFTVAFTTVSWIVVTLLTPATNQEVLKSFFERIQPAGVWTPFRKSVQKNYLLYGALCWISGLGMAYSLLFLMGSILLQSGGIWTYALVLSICFLVFRMAFPKLLAS